ncbi:MAG TPA: TolC family protein [Gemmatimonadaceae bacterium]|nr:TolC family protein [Gemmatimonadaceae bacterium]
MFIRLSQLGLVVAFVIAPTASGQATDTVRLSIADAVARGIRESDEVRLAAAQVDVTEAQVTTARAAGLPSLQLTGNYTQVERNARATIVGQIFGQNYNYTTSLNLTQPLFQGGRIFAGARAAADVRRAARYDLAETRALLSVAIQRAYLQVLLNQQLADIQARNIQLAEERLALVQRLEGAGRAARYEVLRARVERTNLQPGLIQARNNVELALIELRRLLNIPATRSVVLTSELDTAGVRTVARSIAADSSRPPVRAALRAAQHMLDARHEGVRVARAEFLPTINAFFRTGYTALPASSGFPTRWGNTSSTNCPPNSPAERVCQNNGWYPDRSLGIQVNWFLFDGLRAKGSMNLAQAQERLARTQLEQERETVAAEQARAAAEFARAEATYEAQSQNAEEAEEAFRIASLRFERGLGTQLEVTDAQLALLTARSNAARGSVDYYLAAAELARARGADVPLPPTRPISR